MALAEVKEITPTSLEDVVNGLLREDINGPLRLLHSDDFQERSRHWYLRNSGRSAHAIFEVIGKELDGGEIDALRLRIPYRDNSSRAAVFDYIWVPDTGSWEIFEGEYNTKSKPGQYELTHTAQLDHTDLAAAINAVLHKAISRDIQSFNNPLLRDQLSYALHIVNTYQQTHEVEGHRDTKELNDSSRDTELETAGPESPEQIILDETTHAVAQAAGLLGTKRFFDVYTQESPFDFLVDVTESRDMLKVQSRERTAYTELTEDSAFHLQTLKAWVNDIEGVKVSLKTIGGLKIQVKISRDGEIFIDGKKFDNTYLTQNVISLLSEISSYYQDPGKQKTVRRINALLGQSLYDRKTPPTDFAA